MAYVVHLWNTEPLPSLAAAEARLHELRGVRSDAPNPRFAKLIRDLLEQFPYGDADDEIDSIWAEEPEAAQGSAVLTLGVLTDEIEVGLPAIFAAAREHDLIVLDPLGGEVIFPSGEAFGPNGPVFYASEKPALPGSPIQSPSLAAKLLRDQLAPYFEPHGFKKSAGGGTWFQRTAKGCKIEFRGRMHYDVLTFELVVQPKFARELQPLDFTFNEASFEFDLDWAAARQGASFTKADRRGGMKDYRASLQSWERVDSFAAELGEFFERCVFPVTDGINTMADLDRLANHTADADCPFFGLRGRTVDNGLMINRHLDLAVAYAANNPNFESLARTRVAQYDAAYPTYTSPQSFHHLLRALLAKMGYNL